MPTGTKGDYEVGYGKPPRNAGFKKGQSGNPRRRPPGSKNLTTLLNDALNEPVTITENGRRRKITKREAVINQLLNKSASADARSLKILLDLMLNLEARARSSCRSAPRRRSGRRGGPGTAQGEARRGNPGCDRNREITPYDSAELFGESCGGQSLRLATQSYVVLPGLVPGIHVLRAMQERRGCPRNQSVG
jgi:Family of unknown function (DUF5681)